MTELCTSRLRLRQWTAADLLPFAAMNADPEVMRYFPRMLDRAASEAFADRQRQLIAERGWGLWAVEVTATAPFIGFVGLSEPDFDADFMPAVEVGWRLARPFWGSGYATEAATEALSHAFGALELGEVVSFTAAVNERSRHVMERLGMRHEPGEDFDHPRITQGPLRRHVLYRITRSAWTP